MYVIVVILFPAVIDLLNFINFDLYCPRCNNFTLTRYVNPISLT